MIVYTCTFNIPFAHVTQVKAIFLELKVRKLKNWKWEEKAVDEGWITWRFNERGDVWAGECLGKQHTSLPAGSQEVVKFEVTPKKKKIHFIWIWIDKQFYTWN